LAKKDLSLGSGDHCARYTRIPAQRKCLPKTEALTDPRSWASAAAWFWRPCSRFCCARGAPAPRMEPPLRGPRPGLGPGSGDRGAHPDTGVSREGFFDHRLWAVLATRPIARRPAPGIAACPCRRRGRVRVPAGVWRTGAIHLLSRVNLHLEAGATLRFSAAPADYLPSCSPAGRHRVHELLGVIYAFEQEDIAVTGRRARRSAAADNWWAWKSTRRRARARASRDG